jgi:oxygen-dependent protoporphyrinogen oxidase
MPWMDNMPQYTVGHADRVADVVNKLYITWGGALTVAGASYTGVGVNDCVLNVRRSVVAENLLLCSSM